MADPKVLYAVVSVVFAGLMVWLAFVFRAKEPWAVAPVAPPPAAAKPEAKPAAAEEDDDEDEDDEEEDADDAEGEKVTVKNEVATEEAIEKAKKSV